MSSSQPELKLVVLRGATRGKEYPIEEGSNLIGRWDPEQGAFPEIDLEHEDIEAKISRKHAIIERQGSKVTLEDIGSLNGTFINRGPRLEEGEKVELNHGDELIVGKTFLKFVVQN